MSDIPEGKRILGKYIDLYTIGYLLGFGVKDMQEILEDAKQERQKTNNANYQPSEWWSENILHFANSYDVESTTLEDTERKFVTFKEEYDWLNADALLELMLFIKNKHIRPKKQPVPEWKGAQSYPDIEWKGSSIMVSVPVLVYGKFRYWNYEYEEYDYDPNPYIGMARRINDRWETDTKHDGELEVTHWAYIDTPEKKD